MDELQRALERKATLQQELGQHETGDVMKGYDDGYETILEETKQAICNELAGIDKDIVELGGTI